MSSREWHARSSGLSCDSSPAGARTARRRPCGIDPANLRVLRYGMATIVPTKPVSWSIPRRPLGAHMSIAGGLDLAIERGVAIGCTAIQIFDKSNNQWAARPLGDDEVARFRTARSRAGI